MATALFVTTKDIKRYSILNGNLDPDKLIFYVEIAMDTSVQMYTGTVLFEKVQSLISSGDINLPANAKYP